jgi:hypothetical protein
MNPTKNVSSISLVLSILSVSSFCTPLPAKAFEDTTYICNTGKYLIFIRENTNGQLVYTAFQGNYNSTQRPERDPDLVLYNGRRSLITGSEKQLMTWKASGGYTYQIIAPTPKAEEALSGYLVVKRNGRTIIRQQCRI